METSAIVCYGSHVEANLLSAPVCSMSCLLAHVVMAAFGALYDRQGCAGPCPQSAQTTAARFFLTQAPSTLGQTLSQSYQHASDSDLRRNDFRNDCFNLQQS